MADSGASSTGERMVFMPWAQVRDKVSGGWLVIIPFVVIGFIILMRWRNREISEVQVQDRMWEAIRAICREHSIKEPNVEGLLKALKRINVDDPRAIVSSLAAFEKAEGQLTNVLGLAEVNALRQELFAQLPETGQMAAVSQEGTHQLTNGQSIKVDLRNANHPFPCGIVSVRDRTFVVAFSQDDAEEIDLIAGDKVTGYFQAGDSYVSFETEVLEVSRREFLLCSLAHTHQLAEVHHRGATRVRTDVGFSFRLCRMSAGQGADGKLIEPAAQVVPGTLCDISTGGCAIGYEAGAATANKGDMVKFPVALDAEGKPAMMMGTVVGIENQPGSRSQLLLHVKFIGVDDGMQEKLAKAILGIQKQKARKAANS